MSSLDALQPPTLEEEAITELVERVTESLRPGGILLFHDGGGEPKPNSAPAVGRTIEVYRAAGYRFVDPAGYPIPPVSDELVDLCPAAARLDLPFADVARGHPDRHAIACATQLDLLRGRTAVGFAPGDPITRAQAATMLDRAITARSGPETADDGEADAHADGDAADPDAAEGDTTADPDAADGAFEPDTPVRRDQLATMLAAVATALRDHSPAPGTSYLDVPADHTHAEGIALLTGIGVATGDRHGRFEPERSVTRAQAAALMARLEAWLARD